MWHRQNWNIVYPNIGLDEFELEGLQGHVTYIAGFTDSAVEARTDLYDLFIDGLQEHVEREKERERERERERREGGREESLMPACAERCLCLIVPGIQIINYNSTAHGDYALYSSWGVVDGYCLFVLVDAL